MARRESIAHSREPEQRSFALHSGPHGVRTTAGEGFRLMSRGAQTPQANIELDTPLRLVDAAQIAFPAGGMTVSGLRKERDRNRLVIEKIAGKELTTLRH